MFAKINKLRVIEDAAHAFGTIYKKKRIGSFGDIVLHNVFRTGRDTTQVGTLAADDAHDG